MTQLPIKHFWLNAPNNIDAAYEDPVQDKLFFFKGIFSVNLGMLKPQLHLQSLYLCSENSYCSLSLLTGRQVWAFNGIHLEPSYPKTLSSFGLSSLVRNVSAAVHDKSSGKTLLFIDKVYYRWVKCCIVNKSPYS